jgi:hypothetical protein
MGVERSGMDGDLLTDAPDEARERLPHRFCCVAGRERLVVDNDD